MKYDYDIITIGAGPAGMAVSAMGAEMGLKVCLIEKDKIGGECMNVGCIPSKALLQIAKIRNNVTKLSEMELESLSLPGIKNPFKKIANNLDYISTQKNAKMLEKVDSIVGEGTASFVDNHTVKIGDDRIVSAEKIFICAGTKPAVLPIPGIEDVDVLTNENMFKLEEIPESLTIVGGSAIGAEMGQAFSRLGSKVTIVQMDEFLVPFGDSAGGKLLEDIFEKEGITVYNNRKIERVANEDGRIALYTEEGEKVVSEKLLLAAGRNFDYSSLELENAGVELGKRGIAVNKYLRTSAKNIYAPGDCNGKVLLSHAAMHQGMLALMNSMMPKFMRRDFTKYVVPWTVFTEPQISQVGKTEFQLRQVDINYEVIQVNYGDYGAAIAENLEEGFIRAYVSKWGKIYGVQIVGDGSGEMIGEWALAIQKNICLPSIMMLQHSFPTMSFLSKRVAETWAMKKMASPLLKKAIKFMFKLSCRCEK